MGARRKTNILHVGINGRHVGTLQRKGGVHAFTYDEDWLSSEDAHPISLSMPMTTKRHTGDVVRYFFENLLPDDMEIRKLIVDRVGAHSLDTMDLLNEIGKDCVGALSLTTEPAIDTPQMRMRPMTEKDVAEHLRKTLKRKTLGMDDDDVFRISIAGAQEKTALTFHDGKWHQPIGDTPTTHILKLPLSDMGNELEFNHSVDNEWFCLRVLHHLGFQVAQADILTLEDQKVLSVERFDRAYGDDGQLYRLSQEDMCQALGTSGQIKYESNGGPGAKEIASLLRFGNNSDTDPYEFYLAQYVYWLMMAIDGHAKNFSVYIDHTGYWMTPLYDVMSAFPIKEQFKRRQLKMAMRVLTKNNHYVWSDIQMRHWHTHSKKTGLDHTTAKQHIEQINDTLKDAIDNAFSDARPQFHQATGEIIAEGMLATAKL